MSNGVSGIIPEVWSSSILRAYEKSSVFAACLSRAYQGDLKVGNVVKIPMIGSVSVKPYKMREAIKYDDLDADTIDVTIDQSDYFAIRCEDIEKTQASADFLDAATKSAAYSLRDHIDRYVANVLEDGAGVTIGEDKPIASQNFLSLFTTAQRLLDENNIPTGGRFLILPPHCYRRVLEQLMTVLTDNKQLVVDTSMVRFYGFNVFVSNNLPTDEDGNSSVFAGIADCATHLIQIDKVEALRDSQQFGDLIRGLAVYHSQVLKPEALIKAKIQPLLYPPLF